VSARACRHTGGRPAHCTSRAPICSEILPGVQGTLLIWANLKRYMLEFWWRRGYVLAGRGLCTSAPPFSHRSWKQDGWKAASTLLYFTRRIATWPKMHSFWPKLQCPSGNKFPSLDKISLTLSGWHNNEWKKIALDRVPVKSILLTATINGVKTIQVPFQ
jgi:hypothetical protein